MNRRANTLLRAVSMAMLSWAVISLLGRLHLAWPVVLLAAANSATIWVVRYERRLAAALYAKPLARPYVNCVCRCSGEQPPLESAKRSQRELLVRSDSEFQQATHRAKQLVRGHDAALGRLFACLQEAVTLRQRRNGQRARSPLASFLLVGADGVGKRHIARVLAKLLYREGTTLSVACDSVTTAELFGTDERPGKLTEAVCRQPFQLIVFERIETGQPEVIQSLTGILTGDGFASPSTGQAISFQGTTIIMTTTGAASALEALSNQSLAESAWQKRAFEAVTAETFIDQRLLSAVSEVVLCRQPDDLAKSEVVAMLMQEESAAHGVSLTRVDPEIISSQVALVDDATGFTLTPEHIKKLLRKPLVAATEQRQTHLALRIRRGAPHSWEHA